MAYVRRGRKVGVNSTKPYAKEKFISIRVHLLMKYENFKTNFKDPSDKYCVTNALMAVHKPLMKASISSVVEGEQYWSKQIREGRYI